MHRNQYIDGLDGLRTLAVFAVMIYHLHYSWAPGGLLGVGIFFVLSGYLISDILLNQWTQQKRIELKGFWIRRAKRLLPALFFMLIVVIIWCYFFDQKKIPILRKDGLAAFFYVSNWWYIFHQVSYFESFGPPSPFEHLWSLAVEEQFYLLFPLLLWVGLRKLSKSKWLLVVSLILAALSAVLMVWLYQPGTDPSRVYFGTDTRAFALLIGCALAILCPSRTLKNTCSKKISMLLDGLGLVCLLSLAGFIFRMSEYNSFLFQGGLFFISLLTAILIGVIVQPASILGKIFAWKPLQWLGKRSYGIYLCHFPVIVLSSPVSNVDGIQWGRIVLQIVVTIGLAAVSYRWIENPIRYGTITRPLILKSTAVVLVGVICLILPAPNYGLDATATHKTLKKNVQPVVPASANPIQEPEQKPEEKAANPSPSPSPEPEQGPTSVPNPVQETTPAPNPIPEQESTYPGEEPSQATIPNSTANQVTAIGDSIMVDIKSDLEQLIPGIYVDGKVGRQLIQTPPEISKLKSDGKLGSIVVIELGTNGPFTREQLENLFQSLDNPKKVIFVNTRVPRSWESDVNSMLAKFVESTPNTILVDWYSKSANQASYFAPDGVHLTQEGSRVLAQLIKDAI